MTEPEVPVVRTLIVRLKEEFGYERVTDLKKAYDELSEKDRLDMIEMFNSQGKPTKLS